MHKSTRYSNGIAVSCCTIQREHLSTRPSKAWQCICCSLQQQRSRRIEQDVSVRSICLWTVYQRVVSSCTHSLMNNARKKSMQIETERIVPQEDSPISPLRTQGLLFVLSAPSGTGK